MAQRGRKFKVDLEIQLKEYCDKSKDLLDANNNILPASANVYQVLSEKLGMTPKAIQLAVCKNQNRIFGENVVAKNPIKEIDAFGETFCEFTSIDAEGTTVSVVVDEKHKSKFEVITVEGKFRHHKSFKPGWSDILQNIITEQTNLQCVLSFKRVNIVGNEFTTIAKCTECGASIIASSLANRSRLSIDIKNGEGQHTFKKRRRLTVARSKSLLPALESDTVYNVHTDLVNEFGDCDVLPRDYVSEKSLSNLKHRYISNKNTSINELRNMKYSPDYCEIIKEIGTDPFFVLYWTPAQKFVFSQTSKRERVVVSLDATGGLVSNLGLMTELAKKVELPHIFLYQICLKQNSGKSIPIAQCLSAQQDTKKIIYFLERFLDDFGCPHEVNLDDGKALLKACAKSFACCENIAEYTKKCFEILNNVGQENLTPLKCFIRLDVSHFIFNLHKTKIFDKSGVRVKHFYLSLIGGIMQLASYDDIKSIVKDILILANYAVEGTLDDGFETPTAQSRVNLQRFIRTHNTDFMPDLNDKDEGEVLSRESNDDINEKIDASDIEWYSNMLQEIQNAARLIDSSPSNLSSNVSINHYHCNKVNEFLRDLILRLPLWGSVMCSHFKSSIVNGTSCDVERRFGLIKNNIFKNYKLPVSASVFMQRMVKEINCVATICKLKTNAEEEAQQIAENRLSDVFETSNEFKIDDQKSSNEIQTDVKMVVRSPKVK